MSASRDRRWATPPAYHLEISRGYVRLVRTGGTTTRPVSGRYLRRDDEWVEASGDDEDADLANDARWAAAAEAEMLRWVDDEPPLDPGVAADIARALAHPRGAKGQTPRSRNKTPPVGLGAHFGGEFGTWLREAWSEVVGTTGLPDGTPLKVLEESASAHRLRGVDVAVMFFSDGAEATADRTRVAQYLAREAAKWRQKQPPAGFARIGRYYGVWGRSVGFRPVTITFALETLVAAEIERRLSRWVAWRLHVLRRGTPALATGTWVRRTGDGVTAFGLGPDEAARLLRSAQRAADRKRHTIEGEGGAVPFAPLTILRLLDDQQPRPGQDDNQRT